MGRDRPHARRFDASEIAVHRSEQPASAGPELSVPAGEIGCHDGPRGDPGPAPVAAGRRVPRGDRRRPRPSAWWADPECRCRGARDRRGGGREDRATAGRAPVAPGPRRRDRPRRGGRRVVGSRRLAREADRLDEGGHAWRPVAGADAGAALPRCARGLRRWRSGRGARTHHRADCRTHPAVRPGRRPQRGRARPGRTDRGAAAQHQDLAPAGTAHARHREPGCCRPARGRPPAAGGEPRPQRDLDGSPGQRRRHLVGQVRDPRAPGTASRHLPPTPARSPADVPQPGRGIGRGPHRGRLQSPTSPA